MLEVLNVKKFNSGYSGNHISNEGIGEFLKGIVESGVKHLLEYTGKSISEALIQDSEDMLKDLAVEQFKDTSGNSVSIKDIQNYVYGKSAIIKWIDVQSQLDNALYASNLTSSKILECCISVYKGDDNYKKYLPEYVLGCGYRVGFMSYSRDGNKVTAVQGTNKANLSKFIKTYLQIANNKAIDELKAYTDDNKVKSLALEVIKRTRTEETEDAIKECIRIVNKVIAGFYGIKIASVIAGYKIAKDVLTDMRVRYKRSTGVEGISNKLLSIEELTNMEETVNTQLPEEGGDTELVETDIQIMEEDLAEGFKELEVISEDHQVIHGLNNIVKELEETSGVDNTGAELIVETLENIYRRHGIPRRYKSFEVPSVENMGNLSSKLDMAKRLRVTLEEENKNSENAIKKAWNWICEQFGKLVDRVFNSFNKLGDKAKALADKINNDKNNMKEAKAYTLTRENPDSKQINDARVEDEVTYASQVVNNLDSAADAFIEGMKNVGTDGGKIPTMPNEDTFTKADSWKTIKVSTVDAALKALTDDSVGLTKQVEKFKSFSENKKKPLFDALKAGQDKLEGNQANENTVKLLKTNAESFNKHIQGYTKIAQAIYNACEKFYSTWKDGNSGNTTKEGNATNTGSSTSAENAGAAK